jgi:hypothetical protein
MDGKWITRLVSLVAVGVVTLAAPVAAEPGLRTAGSPGGRTQYTGGAYGSDAFDGSTIQVMKSADVSLGGCGVMATPVTETNATGSVDGGVIVRTGAVQSSASATTPDGIPTSRATSEADHVNILGGMVRADEAKVVATTTLHGSSFQTSASGTTLTNLVVNGQEIGGVPSPNTSITLPGIGNVVLNRQTVQGNASSASLGIDLIHVYVTVANDLVPTGTQIIVAHAKSGLKSGVGGVLGGFAYGTHIAANGIVTSGRTANVSLGCMGGSASNSAIAVDLPGAGTVGSVQDRVDGSVTTTTASGEASSSVAAVNLLKGMITASAVSSGAQASTDGATFSFSDEGSSFAGLVVDGHAYPTTVSANTKVDLAGVGTLWLHRVLRSANSINVRMIELIVTTDNSLGLPVGADVQVAVAQAAVH